MNESRIKWADARAIFTEITGHPLAPSVTPNMTEVMGMYDMLDFAMAYQSLNGGFLLTAIDLNSNNHKQVLHRNRTLAAIAAAWELKGELDNAI